MQNSYSEFVQIMSSRIPVSNEDSFKVSVRYLDENLKECSVIDVELIDLSLTGFAISCSDKNLKLDMHVDGEIQFRKSICTFSGAIVRSFEQNAKSCFGVNVEAEDQYNIKKVLEALISSFNEFRLRSVLTQLAIKSRHASIDRSLESFSLLMNLINDLSKVKNKKQFCNLMLQESCKIFSCESISIYVPSDDSLICYASSGTQQKKEKIIFEVFYVCFFFRDIHFFVFNGGKDVLVFDFRFSNILY